MSNATDAPQVISIDFVGTLSLEDIGDIGPVARTFALQNAADWAERKLDSIRDTLYEMIDREERQRKIGSLTPAHERVERSPEVIEAKANAEAARQAAREAQAEIGGVAFCVARDKLEYAHKTIDALSRKAAKIDSEPLSLIDTDETVILNYCYAEDEQRGYHANFEHVFVIFKGATPRIPGFEFLATVTTTEAGNLVKTVPGWAIAHRRNLREQDGQAWLDSLDLSRFRETGAICEHCGTVRDRTDTFVVYNEETGEAKQVGRTCLRDFTGINNPERILKVLQQVWEAMRSLSGSKGERPAILMDTYMAHCAVVYRESTGYVKGEHKGFALTNMWNMEAKRTDSRTGQQLWTEPTEDDIAFGRAVRRWALENLDSSDFGYNVKVAITPDVLNIKAAGYAAAAFAAYQRAAGQVAEKKVQAERSFIGEMGKRGEFTLTVERIDWRANSYKYNSDSPTYTFVDEDGNRARWRATDTNGMVIGGTYKVKATVNKDGQYPGHEDHPKYGKTTHVSRVAVIETISEPEEEA